MNYLNTGVTYRPQHLVSRKVAVAFTLCIAHLGREKENLQVSRMYAHQ